MARSRTIQLATLALSVASLAALFGARARHAGELSALVGEALLEGQTIDRPLPELVLAGLDGRSWETRAFAASAPLLLHLWATWCAPCREELPALAAAVRALGADAPRVLAVSVDEDPRALADFLAAAPVALPIARDPGGRLAAALGTSKYPETFLIGRGGRAELHFVGPKPWAAPHARAYLARLRESGGLGR